MIETTAAAENRMVTGGGGGSHEAMMRAPAYPIKNKIEAKASAGANHR